MSYCNRCDGTGIFPCPDCCDQSFAKARANGQLTDDGVACPRCADSRYEVCSCQPPSPVETADLLDDPAFLHRCHFELGMIPHLALSARHIVATRVKFSKHQLSLGRDVTGPEDRKVSSAFVNGGAVLKETQPEARR